MSESIAPGERLTLADLHMFATLVESELYFCELDGYDVLAQDYQAQLDRLNLKISELEAVDDGSGRTEV